MNEPLKRVLIVEDEQDLSTIWGTLLRRSYQLDFAYSGSEGVRKVTDEHYDLAVIDLLLPGVDGYGVHSKLKEEDARSGRKTKVLVITAAPSQERERKAREAGFDDYMAKPFSLKTFKEKIDALLAASV